MKKNSLEKESQKGKKRPKSNSRFQNVDTKISQKLNILFELKKLTDLLVVHSKFQKYTLDMITSV